MINRAITHIRSHARQKNLPSIYDEETFWYQGWYFDLRLEEELARAVRYSIPLTILVIHLKPDPETAPEELCLALQRIAVSKLRRSDLPAILDSSELAICLTHTRPDQATLVAERLRKALEPFHPSVGAASFPEHGRDVGRLIAVAEHEAVRLRKPKRRA